MFSGLAATQERRSLRWTTLASFSLQAVLAALALVLPLFRPQTLTEAFANRRIFVPSSNGELQTQAHPVTVHTGGVTQRNILVVSTHPLIFGTNHPSADTSSPEAPQPDIGTATGGPGLPPLFDIHSTILPRPPAPVPLPTRRVSRVMEGNLIHRVEPQYPPIAKQLGIQGAVIVKAVISREGTIEQAHVISGQGMLSNAALDAIRQWKYRPYYLNNEPIEVETQITVNFILGR
jgi:protein TonB